MSRLGVERNSIRTRRRECCSTARAGARAKTPDLNLSRQKRGSASNQGSGKPTPNSIQHTNRPQFSMARGAASASVAPARSVSSRSAKTKANASLADDDKDLDRLIAKHDERGARGWAKKSKAGEAAGSSSSSKLEVAPTMPEEKQVSKPKGKAKGKGKKKDVTEPDAVVEEVHEDEVVEARINSVAPLQASKRHINSGEGSSVDAIASPKKDSSDKMHSTPKKKDKSSSSPKKKEKTSSSPKKASSPAKYFSSPSKPRQRGMPEEQIRSFLDNYDLEGEWSVRACLTVNGALKLCLAIF